MVKKFRELHSLEELNQALAESSQRPVLLFKHSLTCPISAHAFHEFQSFMKNADPHLRAHLITVQTDRPVSDEVAARLDVRHETPQAILVRNDRRVWSASHFEITAAALAEAVQKAAE